MPSVERVLNDFGWEDFQNRMRYCERRRDRRRIRAIVEWVWSCPACFNWSSSSGVRIWDAFDDTLARSSDALASNVEFRSGVAGPGGFAESILRPITRLRWE